jgi:WD40 repeat protein
MPLLIFLALQLPVHAEARPISGRLEGNCQAPQWSDKGGKLSFELNDHDAKRVQLYVYTPGADLRRLGPKSIGSSSLTAGFGQVGAEAVVHDAAWAPSFIDRVVFSAAPSSRDYDLFIDGAGSLAPSPGADGSPDWSPDGRWIVFTSARTGQGDLYLQDVHQIEVVPSRLTSEPDTSELDASFSPDSQELVYVGHADDGDKIFLIRDLLEPHPWPLTSLQGSQTRPTWSPDGARVAFYANPEVSDRADLYVVDVRGPAVSMPPRLIAAGVVPNQGGPVWTPNAQELVYVLDDDANYDPIYRVAVDGGLPQEVGTGTVGNGDLDVGGGTDGRVWIAVAAQGLRHDRTRDFKRIYVMELK